MTNRNCQSRLNALSVLAGSARVAGLAALLLLTTTVIAQEVAPQPATPDDQLRLETFLPAMACFNEVTEHTVSVNGASVAVDFVVEDAAAVCPTVMPPLRANVDLGTFAPGDYQLEVTGTVNDQPFGPLSTEFEVVRGSTSIPIAIPTLSPAAWWLMLLAMAIIGAAALRQSRS